jgi:hypothetical protein
VEHTQSVPRPNDLTTQQLEKLAESSDTVGKTIDDPGLRFLATFDIAPGRHKVPKKILREFYCLWTNKKNAILEAGKLLDALLPSDETRYMLSKTPAHINQLMGAVPREVNKFRTLQLRSFELFLSTTNLTTGDTWVESYILYHMYDNVVTEHRRFNIGFYKFCEVAKLFFEYKSVEGSGTCFKVDAESVRKYLTDDQLVQLRQGNQWKNEKKKAKKAPVNKT